MNHSVSGVGAYDTSDVLSPHPTKPGYWKVYGRADDQIMHSNGEKVSEYLMYLYWRSYLTNFTRRIPVHWVRICGEISLRTNRTNLN